MNKIWSAKTMPDMHSLKIDRDNYYHQVLNGFYELPCKLQDGTPRMAHVYVPTGIDYNMPLIWIFTPNGVEPGEFLETSGWREEADTAKVYLVMLSPASAAGAPGCWQPYAQELPYLTAVRRRISNRPLFCTVAFTYYGAGYGAGADILMENALRMPQSWAGVMLEGGSGLSEELKAELDAAESNEPGIPLNRVQLPAWIAVADATASATAEVPAETSRDEAAGQNGSALSAGNARLLDYLKLADHSVEPEKKETIADICQNSKGADIDICQGSKAADVNIRQNSETADTDICQNSKGADTNISCEVYEPAQGGTIDEDWCAKVVVSRADEQAYMSFTFVNALFERLFRGTCRYAGNRIGALRHDGPIFERGFKKFTMHVPGGYCEDGSDYYNREWYIYQPKSAKAPMPAIFLFHGRGGSGHEMADRSGWARIADREGILLIMPSAPLENVVRNLRGLETNFMYSSRWNTSAAKPEYPCDVVFLDFLYQWVMEHYEVDRSRVYACGQSNGGMMTWGCAAYRPDYFAAVAPVSAKNINKVEAPLPYEDGSMIPIMAFLGTVDQTFPGGFATEEAKELVDHFAQRGCTKEQWSDFTFMKGGEGSTFKKGLFSNYIFHTQDGVPMLRLVEVDTKLHAILPSESQLIWDEWFTKFTKDPETKELYYEGKKVRDFKAM